MSTTAHADFIDIYQYSGPSLTSYYGSSLQNASISFEFSTPNPLPPNLSFDPNGLLPPQYSVPVTDWSVSVGPYQAKSTPDNALAFLLFDTDASGRITGWFVALDAVTTDDANLLFVAFRSPGLFPTIYGSFTDFVQVNPNLLGAGFTEFAGAGPPVAVPGPTIGAGLPGLIFAGGCLLAWWRNKRRAQAVA